MSAVRIKFFSLEELIKRMQRSRAKDVYVNCRKVAGKTLPEMRWSVTCQALVAHGVNDVVLLEYTEKGEATTGEQAETAIHCVMNSISEKAEAERIRIIEAEVTVEGLHPDLPS